MPTMPPPQDKSAVPLSHYPKEHHHVGHSVALAIFLHVFVAGLVCLIAYWLGIATLKDLLSKGGSIAESGPAPEEPMTVELQLEDVTPPPTPHPVFIQEIVKPKVVPPPEIKKPIVKPDTKPKPRYTAPNAKGEGKTQNVSVARAGTSGLPHPSYPAEALNRHEGGTVGMEVIFGADGSVQSATVIESSGVTLLDISTRNFVYGHWKNVTLANTTVHIPIIYDPVNHTVAPGH
jgi:TonB family protein